MRCHLSKTIEIGLCLAKRRSFLFCGVCKLCGKYFATAVFPNLVQWFINPFLQCFQVILKFYAMGCAYFLEDKLEVSQNCFFFFHFFSLFSFFFSFTKDELPKTTLTVKLSPGARFSKVPKSSRVRKAIFLTPTRILCKAVFFICCKENKN